MLHAPILTILCLLSVALIIAVDVDVLCDLNSQACNVDDLSVEERGSSLLQVELRLHSDRELLDLPMGSLALLSEKSDTKGAESASSSDAPPSPEPSKAAASVHARPQDSGVASDSVSLMQGNETKISRRQSVPVDSEAAFDSIALMQNNETRISRRQGEETVTESPALMESNEHSVDRRLSLLGLGQRSLRTKAGAVLWILLIGAAVACLLMFLILATEEPGPAAQKNLVKHKAASKHERFSPQVQTMMPQRGSPVRETRSGSLMGPMDSGGHSLPPTSTVPQYSRTSETSGEEVASQAPPPICPSLILPHTEARFMVPMEQLRMSGLGALDIKGTSGRKLLHATVSDTPDGRRCLSVASCGVEDDPRVTVFTPSQQTFTKSPLTGSMTSAPTSNLEIYGKSGAFYGTLVPAPGGGMLLKHESGNVVLAIQAALDEDFRMTASSYTGGGDLLASAGRNMMVGNRRIKADLGDSWKLQVKPGVDAVLVVSCMLGALLLGGLSASSSSSRYPGYPPMSTSM